MPCSPFPKNKSICLYHLYHKCKKKNEMEHHAAGEEMMGEDVFLMFGTEHYLRFRRLFYCNFSGDW